MRCLTEEHPLPTRNQCAPQRIWQKVFLQIGTSMFLKPLFLFSPLSEYFLRAESAHAHVRAHTHTCMHIYAHSHIHTKLKSKPKLNKKLKQPRERHEGTSPSAAICLKFFFSSHSYPTLLTNISDWVKYC